MSVSLYRVEVVPESDMKGVSESRPLKRGVSKGLSWIPVKCCTSSAGVVSQEHLPVFGLCFHKLKSAVMTSGM